MSDNEDWTEWEVIDVQSKSLVASPKISQSSSSSIQIINHPQSMDGNLGISSVHPAQSHVLCEEEKQPILNSPHDLASAYNKQQLDKLSQQQSEAQKQMAQLQMTAEELKRQLDEAKRQPPPPAQIQPIIVYPDRGGGGGGGSSISVPAERPSMDSMPKVPSPVLPVPMGDSDFFWKCPTCGDSNDESYRFCPKCGAPNTILNSSMLGKDGLLTNLGRMGDNDNYKPCETRDGGWVLKNASNSGLTMNCHLVKSGGEEMLIKTEDLYKIELKPHEEHFLMVQVVAPSLPGTYKAYYQLQLADTRVACDNLEMIVVVKRQFDKKHEKMIATLIGMGFVDRQKVIQVLEKNKWNVAAAAMALAEDSK